MSVNILPSTGIPELPPDEAIRTPIPVEGPVLLSLSEAVTYLIGSRARRRWHRSFTLSEETTTPPALRVNQLDDVAEQHSLKIRRSLHAERFHVRVVYQADKNAKPAPTIGARLETKIEGTGSLLDEVTWDAADGSMSADDEPRDSTYGRQFATYEVRTAPLSRPGAAATVSRPLEIGASTLRDLAVFIDSSAGVKVTAIEVWEAFEEVISQ